MLTPGNAARTSTRRRKLRQAVGQAFTPQSLARALVEGRPARQLTDHVSAADFQQQTFELIDAANHEGWIRELLDTLLEARADSPGFQEAVRPIAEALARGAPLDDGATDDGDQDEVTPRFQAVIWTTLSLGIVGTSTATGVISGTISFLAAVPLVVGVAFLGFGVMGIVVPRSRFIRGLSRRDNQIIPGIGAVVLLLAFGFSWSSVITASEWIAARRTITVVAAVQNAGSPLTGLEVFSEVAASDESKAGRIWKLTSQQSGEAIFDLRPNAFYRFGVKMPRLGTLQEGAFFTRLIKEPERIEFDVRNIPDGGWLRGGEQRAAVGVVQENEPVSPNLTAAARTTIQKNTEIRIASPDPLAGLRSERGPLGLPPAPCANGKERVLVLGEGATPVPTDLFRILLRRSGPDWNVQAFLVPNGQTVERNPLTFATSVDALEKLMGTNLLPNLPPQLKTIVNINDWRSSPAQPSSPPT